MNTLDKNGFHGIFSKLNALDILDHGNAEIYEGDFADFYNSYVGSEIRDIPVIKNLLQSPDARVLDLACGAGRIGIALARGGIRVDGLELSSDMLDIVAGNLANESPEVGARLRFYQGDMCDFDLPDRYDLIVLGATSISLLATRTQRLGLFNMVRKHLAPGGQFCFDILDLSQGRWKSMDNFLDVVSRETEAGLEVSFVGQKFYPDERRFVFNVYRELIEWNGDTRRSMATSTKHWLEPEELVEELGLCGLTVSSELDQDKVKFFMVTPTGE